VCLHLQQCLEYRVVVGPRADVLEQTFDHLDGVFLVEIQCLHPGDDLQALRYNLRLAQPALAGFEKWPEFAHH
jgi:hypothetical protein